MSEFEMFEVGDSNYDEIPTEMNLLPDGEHEFEIISATPKTSKKSGAPYLSLCLMYTGGEVDMVANIFDILMSTKGVDISTPEGKNKALMFKRRWLDFCDAFGFDPEQLNFHPSELHGLRGRALVVTELDQKGEPRNAIKRYIKS